LNCEFCGSCVSVCPVGALISRPFKFQSRWWALNKVKTVCSYCGTGCQLTLGVKDNKVLTTIYDENQGFHNGQLCTRGRWGYQFVNSDKRLTTPLIRKNGTLTAATWDEAMAVVTKRLSEEKAGGGTTVAGLVTPRLTNEELFLFRKLFKEVLGSDNLDHSAGYAHDALTKGARESLGYSASSAVIADIQKTDLLLVVKSDAYETHPVLGFEVNLGVKRQGVDLRIVSDKRGKLSKLPKAVTYVHKPGSELLLFKAMARVIFDENLADAGSAAVTGLAEFKKSLEGCAPDQVAGICGLTATDITDLARDYAKAEKALILLPLGLGYPGHGAELVQALINLALLTGKIGKEGCGVLIMGEKNNSQGAADLGLYPTAGGKNAAAIIEGCASGTVKTLYIAGENPVISYPNRKLVEAALDKVEFLVVQDLFMTETAEMADVVLPACSFAEKEGTFTSAGKAVQRVNRAVKPVGLSRSDFDVFNQLSSALGGAPISADPETVFAAISAAVTAYRGLSFTSLGDGAVYEVSGAAKFVPVAGASVTMEEGKLALVTGSALNHCGTLSRYGEGPMLVCPEGYLELGREDARKLGIAEDDRIKVTSAAGEIVLKAKVGSRMPQGVVFAPYHFGEQSVNNLSTGAPVTWVSIGK
ncbi:MAG: NADH-quinone oxidoreductase subunit G, partial [Geobacter sp.]